MAFRAIVRVDDEQTNPASYAVGTRIYSFSTRHINFRHPDEFGLHEGPDGTTSSRLGLRRKLDVGTAFILSCYQHSGTQWSLMGEGEQCRFDAVRVAGLLFQSGKRGETREARAERARKFLEQYSEWCDGAVYEVELEEYDPSEEEPTYVTASCGSLYGRSEVEAWVKEACAERSIPPDQCPVVWE